MARGKHMKQGIYTIIDTSPLTDDIVSITMAGDTSAMTAPGQFINIQLDGFFLRRPVSVYDWDEHTITIVCKKLGRGTEMLSSLPVGTPLDVLTGLGNGFDISHGGPEPLVVGGGVGIPPLYRLTKDLLGRGCRPHVVLGYNTARDIFLADAFSALGIRVTVCTADGSAGLHGLVTTGMQAAEGYTGVFACGPTAMLRAVDAIAVTEAQYSMEERMGCGFGACMGCTHPTKDGYKRVCREGPVFFREEIVW